MPQTVIPFFTLLYYSTGNVFVYFMSFLPQLILQHVHDNFIFCLYVTYLFPGFAHSDSDLCHGESSMR
jgi:hypothetical protein